MRTTATAVSRTASTAGDRSNTSIVSDSHNETRFYVCYSVCLEKGIVNLCPRLN